MTSSEVPCCVCGYWFQPNTMVALNEAILHKDIRRRTVCGTLKDKFLCKGCQSKCTRCKKVITSMQRWQHNGLCMPCSSSRKM